MRTLESQAAAPSLTAHSGPPKAAPKKATTHLSSKAEPAASKLGGGKEEPAKGKDAPPNVDKTFKDEAPKEQPQVKEVVQQEQPDFEKPRPRSRPSDKAPPKRGNSSSSHGRGAIPAFEAEPKKTTKPDDTQDAAKSGSPMVIDQDDEEDEPYELDYDLCEGQNSDNVSAKKDDPSVPKQAPTAPHKTFVLDADEDANENQAEMQDDNDYSEDEEQMEQNQ